MNYKVKISMCLMLVIVLFFKAKSQDTLIEENGFLVVIRRSHYFLPNKNFKNIDSVKNFNFYSLFKVRNNILNMETKMQLNKKPIVLLEETDPPNIRVVDTMRYGYVTIYYKKDENFSSKFSRPEKIQYDNLDSTRVSFIKKGKYLADVFFILPAKENAPPVY